MPPSRRFLPGAGLKKVDSYPVTDFADLAAPLLDAAFKFSSRNRCQLPRPVGQVLVNADFGKRGRLGSIGDPSLMLISSGVSARLEQPRFLLRCHQFPDAAFGAAACILPAQYGQ